MKFLLTHARNALHVALALLVLAAPGHCAYESQHDLATHLQAATYRNAAHPLPLSAPHGCHDESGCLCKGATQARTIDVSNVTTACLSQLLSPADLTLPHYCPADRGGRSFCGSTTLGPKAHSAQQLRALFASFVI